MSERRLRGRVLVPGIAEGEVLVLDEPLSLWGGLDPQSGEIIDRRHPQAGLRVTDRILVLPFGRGSSSSSAILLEAVRQGTAPAAVVTREVDGILALGATVAAELYGAGPAIVALADEDYGGLASGMRLAVDAGGGVWIRPPAQ